MLDFEKMNCLYTAIENGNLLEVEHLLTLEDIRDNITAKNNKAFDKAASGGHSEIMKLLLTLPAAARAENNKALCMASKNGDIENIKSLLTSRAVVDSIQYDYNNRALRLAAQNGHLEIVKLLLECPEVANNIAAYDNDTLRWAAGNGLLETVKLLLTFPEVVNNITAKNNEAFRKAAGGGYFDVAKLLLEFPDVINNIAVKNNRAFIEAVDGGYLDVVNLLLAFPAVVDNITANNNQALRWAAHCGHLDVVNRLLQFKKVRDNIAADDNYALRFAALNGHLDVVNRLLEFPAVRDNITANDNEALRLAAENGHFDVVNRLIQFPAVRAAVLAADNADESLLDLAKNTENSMRALNLQEQGIVNALQKLYPDLDSKNISAIEKELKSLRNYLEKHCKAKRLHLIFSRRNFQYQIDSIYHKAWRYLFARPNSWMSPEANFVEVTEQGRQSSIAEKDWHLLALIWRALNDENIKLNADNLALIENAQRTEEGIASLELIRRNLIESFISTLALLARAHNYDDNEKDDGKLDKPSCSMGVTQRLLTGLIGLEIAEKPDTRPIGVNYLAERFKEQLITHEAKGLLPKLKTLSHAGLVQLNELLDKFIMENDGSVLDELVSILAFESQEVDAFIEEAKNYYGELRFLALHNLSYQGTVYKDAETLMRGLAAHPHIAFANEVFQFVEQELALKAAQQNEADTDAVMTKANVLQFSETESSNAPRRNPDSTSKKRKREEAFDEDSQEEENPKKRRRIG
ncbi:ankyrin repeat domain-containing protein [Candidatus Berkiella cookevillensis]|uniref:Ankyrin repeat domain-containing protein n=1 Tax=Candidatus Berkiella cookevillensis TaxID=437022 RepID=A0A0Q9YSF3_9GAMM|nr:ankyrin repeat domain-containing protein [Candidatus Berkiella cookevillensis]MCS5708543.1 ankyrin repeat domain-containing protein [Candidatus Berkiella cookevillensis]